MARVTVDPREQFSKKLAKWSSIFWFFYMTLLAVEAVLEPKAADAAVYMGIAVSIVMIVNVWAYTRNSIYEKAMYAAKDLEKIKLTWKGKEDDDTACEEEDDEIPEEGESNG